MKKNIKGSKLEKFSISLPEKVDMRRSLENDRYDKNPFVLSLQGKMFLQPRANTVIARGKNIVDTETGEVYDDRVLIGRSKIVDKSQFAKIYASEVGLIYDLKKVSIKVFLYFGKIMDYSNMVIFNIEKDYKKLGYKTPKQVYSGIKELIKKGIIALHEVQGVYWVNPIVMSKGDRFATYTEYIRDNSDPKDYSLEKVIHEGQNRPQLGKAVDKKILAMNKKQEQEYFNELNRQSQEPELFSDAQMEQGSYQVNGRIINPLDNEQVSD